jgi:hypothetical protein
VYVRRVDPSVITFSLTLHRHPPHDKYSFYLSLYLLFIIKTLYSLAASSWADVKSSRKSTTHYAMWNNAFVHWRSKVGSMLATSTTEVEAISVVRCSQDDVFYRKLANELGFMETKITVLWEDNNG